MFLTVKQDASQCPPPFGLSLSLAVPCGI